MKTRPRISLAVADIRIVRNFGADGEHGSDSWSVKAKILHGALGCPHVALGSYPSAADLGWCLSQIQKALTKPEFQAWLADYRRAAPRNLPAWADIAEIVWAKLKATIRGEIQTVRKPLTSAPWSARHSGK